MKSTGKWFLHNGYRIAHTVVVDTIEQRDAIPMNMRFIGLNCMITVDPDNPAIPAYYSLVTGLNNVDWQKKVMMNVANADTVDGKTMDDYAAQFVLVDEKGEPNGVCPLEADGTVDMKYLPAQFQPGTLVSRPYAVNLARADEDGRADFIENVGNLVMFVAGGDDPSIQVRHPIGQLEFMAEPVAVSPRDSSEQCHYKFIKVLGEQEPRQVVKNLCSVLPKTYADATIEPDVKPFGYGDDTDAWKPFSHDPEQVYTFPTLIEDGPWVGIESPVTPSKIVAYGIYFPTTGNKVTGWEFQASEDGGTYYTLDRRRSQEYSGEERRYQCYVAENHYRFFRIKAISCVDDTVAPVIGNINVYSALEEIYEQPEPPKITKYRVAEQSVLPVMTGTSTEGFTIEASSVYNNDPQFEGWRVADGSDSTEWISETYDPEEEPDHSLSIDCDKEYVVTGIEMKAPNVAERIASWKLVGIYDDDEGEEQSVELASGNQDLREDTYVPVENSRAFKQFIIYFVPVEQGMKIHLSNLIIYVPKDNMSLEGDYWCQTSTSPLQTFVHHNGEWEALQFTKLGETHSDVEGTCIPDMTMNFGELCTVFGSSRYNIGHDYYKAFDGVNASGEGAWISQTAPTASRPQFLGVEFNLETKIYKYTVVARNTPTVEEISAPKTWKLQGSNDYTVWADLDSRIDQFTNAVSGEHHSYYIVNAGNFIYYRLLITDRIGQMDYVAIGGLKLYDLMGNIVEPISYSFNARYESGWYPVSLPCDPIRVYDRIGSFKKTIEVHYSNKIPLNVPDIDENYRYAIVSPLQSFGTACKGSLRRVLSNNYSLIGGAKDGTKELSGVVNVEPGEPQQTVTVTMNEVGDLVGYPDPVSGDNYAREGFYKVFIDRKF